MKKKLLGLLVVGALLGALVYKGPMHNQTSVELVHTIYGDVEITEPVLIDLIHSKAFCRLQNINQYGVDYYISKTTVPYTRYTHSLGVFYLLRKNGAPLQEQMAGLLHDVSHTVFSHVGDHVAAQLQHHECDQNDDAYQDCVHVSYLKQTDIADILKKHNVAIEDMDHKCGAYCMLERDLPDICADRLEYVLYGGYIEGWLTANELRELADAVHYTDGNWVFDTDEHAKKFATISIRLCDEIFASDWNIGSYEWAAKALLRAVDLGMITMQDIHFGCDDEVWQKLTTSNDELIAKAVDNILHAKTLYEKSDENQYDLAFTGKFRGIDPLVSDNQGTVRLSQHDHEFAQLFHEKHDELAGKRYYRYRQG